MTSNRELFYRFLGQTSSFPLGLEVDYAEGLYMFDPDGKAYLDLISGISVSSIGHRHPAVVSAIREQTDRYMHLMVYGELVQSPQVKLAEILVQHLPRSLDNVFLVNSGSEAVEGALKLAKRYTERTEVISFRNGYHGSTQGSLSIMGNENMKRSFRPLIPEVKILKFNDIRALDEISSRTACVIAETVQGEAGAVVPSDAFMKALRQRCNETGALLILDEIQAGLGRTGKLWAFEHFGIIPDILLLAKALGGGMPMGAFIAREEIMKSLTYAPVLGHITTFGGNAVCAAAALASMRVITAEKLWEGAEEKGKLFKKHLKHRSIKSVKGKGLMLAVEFDSFEENKKVIARCMELGVLTDWFLFASHAMRIAPPLIISNEQIIEACQLILKALG